MEEGAQKKTPRPSQLREWHTSLMEEKKGHLSLVCQPCLGLSDALKTAKSCSSSSLGKRGGEGDPPWVPLIGCC